MNSEVFVWQFDTRTPLSLLTPLALIYIFPKVPCEEFADPEGSENFPMKAQGVQLGPVLADVSKWRLSDLEDQTS